MTTATTEAITRADRVAAELADRELDALLVTDLVNVRWLTGFTGSNALALVGAPPESTRRFVTDFRYLTQSDEQVGSAWTREIATDLLERIAGSLSGERALKQRLGIATLDGLGVQGDLMHTLQEHIVVDSLARRGRLMAGLLATLE